MSKKDQVIRPKHDKLFRKALEIPQVATELLESHLPKEVMDMIDITTLKVEKDSFIEPDLSEIISDVLFSVKFQGQDGYIFLLCEHQSTPDHWMAFRLFKYMLAICDRYLLLHPKAKHLPLIYNFVLYNGKRKYNAPLNLWDLFQQPSLAKEFWAKDHKVVNVHDIPDAELRQKAWSGILQYFLKHASERKLIKRWEEIADLLPKLTEVSVGYDYIKIILNYTLTAIDKNDKIELKELLTNSLTQETGEEFMTSLAQHWMEEGAEKGIQQGIQIGEARGEVNAIQKVAVNMLKSNLDIKLIAITTGLSVEEIQKLKASLT